MSVDVNYYSFSPSRADKQWSHFIKDLSVLRKKNAPRKKYEKDLQERNKKIEKIETNFELRISEIRKKIFNYFDNKGYVIPWIEWDKDQGADRYGNPIIMTDEDKIKYLMVYGCVYPRKADFKNKNISYLMFATDAPELEKVYKKIIKERDEAIIKFSKSSAIASKEDENIVLNKRQVKLHKEWSGLDYLEYGNTFNSDKLIYDLKILDIYYGSVINKFFENPNDENFYLKVIIEVFNLKNEKGIPNRDEWIRIFQNINSEKIYEISSRLMKEFDENRNDAIWEIKDYLKSVHPVVKDLKETPDSIFIRMYSGEVEVEPKSAKSILIERAKKHTKKYKGLLPPVL